MAYRDRRIPVEEHDAERLPDNVAPADDHGMFPFDGHLVVLEESDDSRGSGGGQMLERATEEHLPEVVCREAVDVLLRMNRAMNERKTELQVQREGKLDDHSRHVSVSVQFLNDSEEIVECHFEREMPMLAAHADALAGCKLPLDVRGARCLLSYLEDDQLRLPFLDPWLQRCEESVGRFFAEENACGHTGSVTRARMA